MIRRDSLKILSLGIGASGALLWPLPALAGAAGVRAVFDGRFAVARAFAAEFTGTHARACDCQIDAAALWFSQLWPQHRPEIVIHGLTTAADAMILADCARREGLTFTLHGFASVPDTLVVWDIR